MKGLVNLIKGIFSDATLNMIYPDGRQSSPLIFPEDGLLLGRNTSEQNKIVHVSWKLWIDFIFIIHGTPNIK
jgi:hypothetical protein